MPGTLIILMRHAAVYVAAHLCLAPRSLNTVPGFIDALFILQPAEFPKELCASSCSSVGLRMMIFPVRKEPAHVLLDILKRTVHSFHEALVNCI